MTVENLKRMKCDNCGKIREVKELCHYPSPWFEVSVTKWRSASGRVVFKKDACSEKCAKKMMREVKGFSRVKPVIRI